MEIQLRGRRGKKRKEVNRKRRRVEGERMKNRERRNGGEEKTGRGQERGKRVGRGNIKENREWGRNGEK